MNGYASDDLQFGFSDTIQGVIDNPQATFNLLVADATINDENSPDQVCLMSH